METENKEEIKGITPITLETFQEILKRTLGKKGMKKSEIDFISYFVMNFFGYEDIVLDNILNQKDRDIFYMLEEEKILKAFQEETTLYKGKDWRIHYWIFNRKEIIKILQKNNIKKVKGIPLENLYKRLKEEFWERGTWNKITE